MSYFSKLASSIVRGRLPYENWNNFRAEYLKRASSLGLTQFSLNLVSLLETEEVWQERGAADIAKDFTDLLKEAVAASFDREALEDKILALRARIKNGMDCLVTYTDRFMVYQYVINCIRYNFDEFDIDDYSDDDFTQELMTYIQSSKDPSASRLNTMEVLKGLPIRMTRSRFFEMVKDGFSVYKDSDRKTLDDFLYMVRSSAMLYSPENMDMFPDLYEYDRHFADLDYEALDADGFFVEDMTLVECIDFLNNQVSALDLLAQLINHLYVVVLSNEYADTQADAYKSAMGIMSSGLAIFEENGPFEPDESMEIMLADLEGVQEEELEELEAADSALGDIVVSKFTQSADTLILLQMNELDSISKLFSTSYFADLKKEDIGGSADAAAVDEAFAAFRAELEPILKNSKKLTSRAIMASVIGYLPVSFEGPDALREHIRGSLAACTSLPEKMALVERLQTVMEGDDWE